MSGGVDSSAAAWLTIQAGFHCIGATMKLFPTDTAADAADAQAVAQRLGIDFFLIDATEQFRSRVMDRFCSCYEEGLTPNPCYDCNQTVKFGFLLDTALEMGCATIVTGHYAQIRRDPDSGRFLLCKAADESKDQSYFLAGLTQHQLAHSHFPLGPLTKAQAREIAESQGFLNARKKDSQDICFVPDGDYMAFLKKHTGKDYPQGSFLDTEGHVVGKHRGAVAYTLGQRKGLGLAMGAPVYVCGKDMTANTVTVGPNEALYSTSLLANDWNWFPFAELTEPLHITAKARYNQPPQPATVYPEEDGTARVVFDSPQRALTPGQAVVLYDGDMVVGGGTIIKIL
jgi:tRNA-specific 2-thiouridylase